MNNPVATYRIQFHKEFTLSNLEDIIPYLKKLGVTTVYASPIFEATPGSEHGYDGVNPHNINPEIGTEEQLRRISNKLKKANINWLQDIVPNHMAFHHHNLWLMDVLEKGPLSVYSSFFDTSLNDPLFHGRIMVPFLGSSLEDVIKNREIKIEYNQKRLVLNYYDAIYPLNPASYNQVLQLGNEALNQSFQKLQEQMDEIKLVEDPKQYSLKWNEILLQLYSLIKDDTIKDHIDNRLSMINNDPTLLKQVIEGQVYRLCHWQETDHRINYRRFFTVNSLICLNIQKAEVFDEYHKTIKRLLEEGVFQGLRVDHIDGLYDPAGYLNELRQLSGDDTYIVVEKILAPDESLPDEWTIEGNTGYDFLSIVNNLLSDRRSSKSFSKFYQNLIGDTTSVHQQLKEKKAFILYNHMNGELDNLFHLFLQLNIVPKEILSRVSGDALKEAIGELLTQFPVYRYYGNKFPLKEGEAKDLKKVFSQIKKSKEHLAPAVDILEDTFIVKPNESDEEFNKNVLAFYQRLMQFTGPLMAKGVEDTLMYTYTRFIGHNEVGDSPETFGYSIADFHQKMIERQERWPLSINASSTHDTKRGEDVRARLNVLTDLSDEWIEIVQQWMELNAELKTADAPNANLEYFIYQTMVGAFPMPEQGDDDFPTRIQEYLQKALREAKEHSSWASPDTKYEEATTKFALQLLDRGRPFWNSFKTFHKKVADFGIINSLIQVMLKFTSPGVPDIYQGCELWDLSLVDPDNRRYVDYEQRKQFIEELESGKQDDFILNLWKNRYNGKIKLWLVQKLLNERKLNSSIFFEGQYIPIEVKGALKDNILAFARRFQKEWYVIVVPLHLAGLEELKNNPLKVKWKDTRIVLPAGAPSEWENILFNTKGKVDKEMAVEDLVDTIPLALLKMKEPVSKRSAGVLLPITSLPSPFGIGDFGPQAKAFADFLALSKQKYWQILPLTPTEMVQSHSPYSSTSSMAGNTLLISPELLMIDGFLEGRDLEECQLPKGRKVDYEEAQKVKSSLFDKAYANFSLPDNHSFADEFNLFCQEGSSWLTDFSLYQVLKEQHNGKPWFEWPDEYKFRDDTALKEFAEKNDAELAKIKWLQFIFIRQWKELRAYCNSRGIQLFGDLPFYISYDSVDVWSNPEIFSLDREGNLVGVAGVPPDYFNSDGQLWGMPVFRWDELKKDGYKWWIQRLKKNLELYDVLRLDHFRAFSGYWEVPASETTAINGKWKRGPGADFFTAVQKDLGKLPFIAEDLGDIDDEVYKLRDQFKLPGMKVLQFAFGDDMPQSLNTPHNYSENFIVYTGTHDNNTSKGWFLKDADKGAKNQLKRYVGGSVNEKNVHKVLSRLAYASVAKIVILPLQDILGLDETARMNTPASQNNNWLWRLKPKQLTAKVEKRLRKWTEIYNRA